MGFYHAVSSVPLRPIPHRIFSQIHFQISDNTLIKIAIFSPKAAKNALFWQSIRPGGCPAFPPDGQIASYIPFALNAEKYSLNYRFHSSTMQKYLKRVGKWLCHCFIP
jgi:hypothetical protein